MKAFWRAEPLGLVEIELLGAVSKAHHLSVFRDNLSSTALMCAWRGSGDYQKALIGALATLGGLHAPLVSTCRFLAGTHPERTASSLLAGGQRVPGWGSSFVKGHPDPIWAPVELALADWTPDLANKLRRVTATIHERGKNLWPNPSAYTAAVAIALRLPAELSPWLLVRGRLDAWTEIMLKGRTWA